MLAASLNSQLRSTALKNLRWVFLCIFIICESIHAQPPPTTAGTSHMWVNSPSITDSVTIKDGTTLRPILSTWSRDGNDSIQLHCGFASNGTANLLMFAVFAYGFNAADTIEPQVLWSANRDNFIKDFGTLELTSYGDLVLRDKDGTKVWCSDTSNTFATSLSMLDDGNLILRDKKNLTVWQSFDHPIDTMLLGQQLVTGQRLSAATWATGQFFMAVSSDVVGALVDSNPPQMYFILGYRFAMMKFLNGRLILSGGPETDADEEYILPSASSFQFLRMDSDGHFRLYGWGRLGWKVMYDITSRDLGVCDYPTFCGSYGICSNGQCSCPIGIDSSPFFEPINDIKFALGCREVTPLSCEDSKYHHLLDIGNISYFNYIDANAASMVGTDIDTCKRACLGNCSCKAALFRYVSNVTQGDCYLPSQVFSLRNNQSSQYNSSAFLKVQAKIQISKLQTIHKVKRAWTKVLVTIGIVSSIVVVLVCGCIYYVKTNIYVTKEAKDYFDDLLEITNRFTYEDVKIMTDDFHIKLGEGGFGAVFQGVLPDGTKVAVKQLDSISQGIKEFVAEVKCVGSIHHFNLVRLIGFCAEKSYKLLIYEYMSNGSLDKWIFHDSGRRFLSWQARQKIVLDIAKGLQYLHQDCRHRIVHLDVKPQNVLLDDKFNAKLSDFGLCKLIDRQQSHVITSVRGTLGYLAPEWLGSKITEKVDVYSFGIVILEIICGRKVLDYSQPEEDIQLLSLLKRKAEEGNLAGMIDERGEDLQLHVEEAVRMIGIAVWCLQTDCSRRPSMPMVVRALEGESVVEVSLDYAFLTLGDAWADKVYKWHVSAPPQASILSGPR